MRKKIIILAASLLAVFAISAFSQNFRSTTTSNTSQTINTGYTSLYHFSIINTSATDTIYTKVYDKATAATASNTPRMTLMCLPSSQIWWENIAFKNAPFIYNYTNGCQIRTVKGVADSYTVSPSSSPIVEINFSNE